MNLFDNEAEEAAAQQGANIAQAIYPVLSPVIRAMKTGNIRTQTGLLHEHQDALSSPSKAFPDCRAGCDYCCHYRVLVTPADVFAIADHVALLPPAQREQLQARVIATAKAVAAMTPDQHQTAMVPCAFLGNSQCQIYVMRPLPCRSHHSLDARACANGFEQPTSPISAPRDLYRVAVSGAVSFVQKTASLEVGLDVTRYELHAALSEAMTNKASFKRWRNGKKAFPNVKDQDPT